MLQDMGQKSMYESTVRVLLLYGYQLIMSHCTCRSCEIPASCKRKRQREASIIVVRVRQPMRRRLPAERHKGLGSTYTYARGRQRRRKPTKHNLEYAHTYTRPSFAHHVITSGRPETEPQVFLRRSSAPEGCPAKRTLLYKLEKQ